MSHKIANICSEAWTDVHAFGDYNAQLLLLWRQRAALLARRALLDKLALEAFQHRCARIRHTRVRDRFALYASHAHII